MHEYIPAYNAGELSPRLHGRTDFQKYRAGLETCENFIPLGEGGLMRRPGTRYVAELKSSSVKGRLKRFQFSTTQAYITEMGDNVLRFCRYQGQITVDDTDASITNGTFDSNINDWDDRSVGGAGNQISHDSTNNRLTLETSGGTASDIGWAEQDVAVGSGNQDNEHVIKFKVQGDPGDKIEFQVGTTSTGTEVIGPVEKEVGYHCVAFTPGATTFYVQFRNVSSANASKSVYIDDVSLIDNSAVEIDSPWPEADLYEVEGPQSADVLYMFHEDYPTYKLQRFGHTTWSLVEIAWQDGPYLDMNTTDTTLTPSATSGTNVTVTASSTEGINGGDGFKSTDVGRLLRIDNPSSGVDWGWAIITNYTSSTVVSVHIKKDFGSTNADTRWQLGSWSETTGYPRAATFFEQRLYTAGNTDQPQTVWASQTADFENNKPDDDQDTVEDDDAFSYTISADDVNAIRWLSAGDDELVIGTAGGEWIPKASGAVLTPSDITVRRQTTHGSAAIQPLRVGNIVLFVQRGKRKLREFGYSFESDGYQAADMTRLSYHITTGGIVEMDYAEEPDSIVYAVRNDGQLLSMTYRRDEDVVGWARHILGGSFSGGNAVVESVAVIPGDDGAGQTHDSTNRDEVWVIVKRTINGATKRYIEFFERDFEEGQDQEDAYNVDSLITYDGVAATAMSGLDHLEGATVKVYADGAVRADKTVSSGAITLDTSASVVQMGYGYAHKAKTLKIDSGNPAGTAVGKKKRIYRVFFDLLNSLTIKFGPSSTQLEEREFREVGDAMDTAAPLFTGEKVYEFPSGWSTDTRIVIESDSPSPFTLRSMGPELKVNIK